MKTILVIDDYEPFLAIIGAFLEREGYECILTPNPRYGVIIATTGRDVDLVITDFVMPVLSGAEVVSEVRRYRKRLPIVLLSGGDLRKRYGADAYLNKSGWQESLPAVLTHLLYLKEELWIRSQQGMILNSPTWPTRRPSPA